MAEHDAAAFGIYRDRLSTANAIEALRAAGFRNMDIVALFPDEIGTWPISPKKPVKLIEGVLIGAIAGLAIASILMWLTELSRTSTGPALTLALLVVGGAAGSLTGALAGKRIETYDQHYENRVRRGDILVSVRCDNAQDAERAKDILRRAGGDDVSSSDRVTIDFALTNRILVRPASERSSIPPLRLVQRENARAEKGGTASRLSSSRRSRKEGPRQQGS